MAMPSQLLRPILLLFLLLTIVGLFVLRPAAETPTVAVIGTPTRAVIQRATGTAAFSAIPTATSAVLSHDIEPTAEILREGLHPSVHQPTASPTPARIQEHIVQPGESLDSIAALYGITAVSIAALNYLAQPDLLFPNQSLLIPLYPKPNLAADIVETAVDTALENAGSEPVVLGYSVLERPIALYTFGSGPQTLIFVGGIHGGYEWNTTVLAYEFIDYFRGEPTAVPETVTVHIIPAANPDGIFAVTGKTGPISEADISAADLFAARFNANGVDLNRNWDCEWTGTAVWWDEIITGGTAPYSEVENQILLAFIKSQEATLRGVIFWHSSAFLVAPGQCGDSPHHPSQAIAQTYAQAAGYPVGSFSAYPVTGDASDALVRLDIPSFAVELSSHEALDWNRNRAGVLALLALYD